MTWTPAALSPVQWYDVPTEVGRTAQPNGTRIAQVNDAIDLGSASISEAFPYSNGALPSPWSPFFEAPATVRWLCTGNKATPTLSSGTATPFSILPIGELDPYTMTQQFDLTWNIGEGLSFYWWPKIDGFCNGYYLRWNPSTTKVECYVYSYTGGVNTLIAATSVLGSAFQTGTHTWKVVISGGTISLYDSSNTLVLQTLADWTYTASTGVAIQSSATGASTTMAVDNISLTSTRSHARSLANWNSVAGQCPTLNTSGIGGLPSLVWNATSSQLLTAIDNTVAVNSIAVVKVGTPFTVLMVADGVAGGTFYTRVANTSNSQIASGSYLQAQSGWAAWNGVYNTGGGTSTYFDSSILTTATAYSICHRCDGTNAGNRLYVNGTQDTAGSNGPAASPAGTSTGTFVLGNTGFQVKTSSGLPYSGRISEVVVLDRAITDLELAQWSDYVHTKYGIAFSDPLATASLTLGGSAIVNATTGAASLTLAGTAAAVVKSTATAAMALAGAGAAQAREAGAGSLLLAAIASAQVPVTATAALALTAAGSAKAPVVVTGSLSLLGAAGASVPVGGSAAILLAGAAGASASPVVAGSLSLVATGSVKGNPTAVGQVSLSGSAVVSPIQISASGLLTLLGLASPAAPAVGVGVLSLLGVAAPAPSPAIGAGTLAIAGQAQAAAAISASGALSLLGAASAGVPSTAAGLLSLLAAASAVVSDSAAASLVLSAAAAPSGRVQIGAGQLLLFGIASANLGLSATGALNLAAIAHPATPEGGAGSIALSAQGSAGTRAVIAAALSLLGHASGGAIAGGGGGALSLGATASPRARTAAAGALSLLGAASIVPSPHGTALLSLLGSVSAQTRTGGTGSLRLSAAAATHVPEGAAGALALAALAIARAHPQAAGSLTLEGNARTTFRGSAALVLAAAVVVAQAEMGGEGFLTLYLRGSAHAHVSGRRARIGSVINIATAIRA